ncbi:MAG: hypothetical protein LBK50_00785 [Candidatus Nomurabacteria bacterium]|jgi:hypothetical protein|nr:hypothetical protein [Candidatus Nomurabacteria bacterium]
MFVDWPTLIIFIVTMIGMVVVFAMQFSRARRRGKSSENLAKTHTNVAQLDSLNENVNTTEPIKTGGIINVAAIDFAPLFNDVPMPDGQAMFNSNVKSSIKQIVKIMMIILPVVIVLCVTYAFVFDLKFISYTGIITFSIAAVVVVFTIIYVMYGSSAEERRREMRNKMFAHSNGFAYISGANNIEALKENSTFVREAIRGVFELSQNLRLAEYLFIVGSGDNAITYSGCYLRFAFSKQVPHIALEAYNNENSFAIDKSLERLALEGNFNEHFSTFVEKDKHVDALKILTPDVMADMIDYASHLDMEMVDNYLYIFAPNLTLASLARQKGDDPAVKLRRFLLASDLIIKEINDQVR